VNLALVLYSFIINIILIWGIVLGEECYDYRLLRLLQSLVPTPHTSSTMILMTGSIDYFGGDVDQGHYNSVSSAEACQQDCQVAGSSSAGHAIIYRESALTFEEWDIAELNEQDEWGLRTVEWAKFTHKGTGMMVDHFNTHLCVCNGDQLLGSAKTIADTIAANRRSSALRTKSCSTQHLGFYNPQAWLNPCTYWRLQCHERWL